MWNFKINNESEQDLKTAEMVVEVPLVEDTKQVEKIKKAEPKVKDETKEQFYQIKNKLFTEIINELNLKAVQTVKDDSSVRRAIKDLVNSLCEKYQYAINDAERDRYLKIYKMIF